MAKIKSGTTIPQKVVSPPAKKEAGKGVKGKKVVEPEKVKVLSKTEIAQLIKDTKKAYVTLTTLPPPPFVNIILGLKLGDYNPKELCSYWFNIGPRVMAVPIFSTCLPTVAYLTGIATALTPLANIPGAKISSTDKSTRDTYFVQLRNGINQIAASCVNLANGNLPIFNLTTFRLKSSPVYFKGQLPAQSFVLYTNLGSSKIRVKTKKNKYAKSYTIYYGVGDYDAETWSFKVGGPDQIILGVAGVLTNFIIVANTDVEGIWPDPQPKRFPFN